MKYAKYVEELSKKRWSSKNARFLKLIERWKKGSIQTLGYTDWFRWEKQLEMFEKIIQQEIDKYGKCSMRIQYTTKFINENKDEFMKINIAGCLAYIFLNEGIHDSSIGSFNSDCIFFNIKEDEFNHYLRTRNFKEDVMPEDCKITVDEFRNIILNGKYKLAKPNLNSSNDLFFTKVIKTPFKTIEKKELIKSGMNASRKINEVVNDLGFKKRKHLRSLFWNISQDSVVFKNPISIENLSKTQRKELEEELKTISLLGNKGK